MGTTRVKVVDLSSEETEVKTSRKHAAKIKPQTETKEENPSAALAETPVESTESKKEKAVVKIKKSTSLRHSGKKYKQAYEKIEKNKLYSSNEAIKLLEKISYTKFDPTVEVHLNVSEKNLRGSVNFPHSIGPKKEKFFLVFSDKFKSENKNVILGSEETIKEIEEGKLKPAKDFNMVIASPAFMPKLVKIAKILGPAGMMPNPKNGTITNNPRSLIEGKESSAYEFRSDPLAPVIHIKLGKLSSKELKIKENLKALVTAIGPSKIKKTSLKTTMSPAIKIDSSQI